jgi:hypothetical protein
MGGGGSIQALELEWGEVGWGASGLGAVAGEAGFDVVVMSELVFDDSAHEALMWTLDKALSRTVSPSPSRCYMLHGISLTSAVAPPRRALRSLASSTARSR